MAEKLKIARDCVITSKGGWTQYYSDHGVISKRRNNTLEIIEADAVGDDDATTVTPEEAQAPDSPDDSGGESNLKVKKVATAKRAAVKKAAKKKASASNGSSIRTVAGREYDVSNYEKVRNASGAQSLDCGDDTAQALRGKDLESVYAAVAKKLKVPEKELRDKYKHLNPGMQRMSLGNRLRKVTKASAAA